MLHYLHFFILTCLHKIHRFLLALSSEVIFIAEPRLIVPLLTLIPLSSYLSLFSIRNCKWKLVIVSFLFRIYA